MPKVVEESSSNRLNPYIGKPINKPLLTPYMRFGLSRKRKTPSNQNKISINSPSDSISLSTSSGSLQENVSHSNFFNQTPVKEELVQTKLTLGQRVETSQDTKNCGKRSLLFDDDTSINKALLTPYMRIGLSRKRKTPSSQNKISINSPSHSINLSTSSGSLQENISHSNFSNQTPVKKELVQTKLTLGQRVETSQDTNNCVKKSLQFDDDTPVASNKTIINKSTDKETPNNKSKKVKKCRKTEKLELSDKNDLIPNEPAKKTPEKPQSCESLESAEFVSTNSKILTIRNKPASAPSKRAVRRIYSSDDDDEPLAKLALKVLQEVTEHEDIKENLEIVNKNKLLGSSNEDVSTNSKILTIWNKPASAPSKRAARRIYSLDDDNEPLAKLAPKVLQEVTEHEDFKENLEIVNKNKLLDSSDEETPKKVSKKKFKRCLSLKKSSSEEIDNLKTSPDLLQIKNYSVRLNLIEETFSLDNKESTDVEKLRKIVIEKRKLVEDLRRAEIYRRSHNIENLKELTAVWKNGCVSALTDLLPHSQAHGNVDMVTLLKRLGIPPEKIAVSPSGDLI